MAALVGTLVFDLLPGLLIAVALSLLWFIGIASRPRLAVLGRVAPGTGRYGDLADHPDAVTVPGLLIVRPDGQLDFGNANWVRLGILRLAGASDPAPRVVVLDLSSSFQLGLPAIDALADLADELRHRGVALWLARVRSGASAEIQASGLVGHLGNPDLHADLDAAMAAFAGGERPTPPSA